MLYFTYFPETCAARCDFATGTCRGRKNQVRWRKRLFLVSLVWVVFCAGALALDDSQVRWRWVYCSTNFQVNEQASELIDLLGRAHRLGYNGMVVSDYKFGRIQGRPQWYYDNLRRVRRAADDFNMQLIPCVMPIGYSGSILQNNPDLAAALPARDVEFVCQGDSAVVADRRNLLLFADFENGESPDRSGWDFVDGPGKSTFFDSDVIHGGTRSLRMENFPAGNEVGNCRVHKLLEVKPWHQYHVSLWLKTEDLRPSGSVRVAALTEDGQSLNYTHLGVKSTQDWRRHDLIFNSLGNERVRFYFGIWSGKGGTMWLDDVEVRETAGVNMLRREGCPIKVVSAETEREYVEGRDFTRWQHPQTGRDPWPGSFQPWHPAPPIELADNSRIGDRERLKVSFYHTDVIHDGQVPCCLSADEVFRYLEEQVEQLDRYWDPQSYMMSHDEIRIAGWCELCRGKTPGELLARNVERCTEIIREVNPDAGIFVWSDMFDPHHNARDNYYLASDTFEGSWRGLDESVRIVNWNGGHRRQSLSFFANRGHRQVIAGYYDHSNVDGHLGNWLDAARGLPGIDGAMYTTWRGDYSNLDRFIQALHSYR